MHPSAVPGRGSPALHGSRWLAAWASSWRAANCSSGVSVRELSAPKVDAIVSGLTARSPRRSVARLSAGSSWPRGRLRRRVGRRAAQHARHRGERRQGTARPRRDDLGHSGGRRRPQHGTRSEGRRRHGRLGRTRTAPRTAPGGLAGVRARPGTHAPRRLRSDRSQAASHGRSPRPAPRRRVRLCRARYASDVAQVVPTIDALRGRREAILAAARGRHASRVRVFGSIARGDAGPASDVDFLVDFGPEASLLDQVGLTQDLEALLGMPVDLISTGGLRPRHRRIRDEAIDL